MVNSVWDWDVHLEYRYIGGVRRFLAGRTSFGRYEVDVLRRDSSFTDWRRGLSIYKKLGRDLESNWKMWYLTRRYLSLQSVSPKHDNFLHHMKLNIIDMNNMQ